MDAGSWVALAVGVIALGGVIWQTRAASLSAREDNRLARRDQWWARVQWALDKLLSDDENERKMGLLMVGRLAASDLATQDDARMLKEVIAPYRHRR